MPAKHYKVTLTPEERQHLLALVSTGKAAAYRLTRAPTSCGNLRLGQMDTDRFPWWRGQFAPRHASPSRFPWRVMAL